MACPDINQRECSRVTLQATPVKMGDDWINFFGYAKNISRSGLFIHTVSPRSVGEEFKVEFTIPQTDITVNCKGKVVWGRGQHNPDRVGPRMGLRFSDIDPATAARIDAWVLEQLKRPEC